MGNVLVIGGNGFVGGDTAALAVEQGHNVWVVVRSNVDVPAGTRAIVVDRRKDVEDYEQQVEACGVKWDLVLDINGRTPEDTQHDVEFFCDKAKHLVFVSSDFVYDPFNKRLPQDEDTEFYMKEAGGKRKREAELNIVEGDTGEMNWTIFRPGHVYGPGSMLGCLPMESRKMDIIQRLQAGERMKLVGGGFFIQQPLYVSDWAELLMSCLDNQKCNGKVLPACGPDLIESRRYYTIIADILGVKIRFDEYPLSKYRKEHPENTPFLCHRYYDISKLKKCGLKVPKTGIEQGLQKHVDWMIEEIAKMPPSPAPAPAAEHGAPRRGRRRP